MAVIALWVLTLWRPNRERKRGRTLTVEPGIECPFRLPRDDHYGKKPYIRKASAYGKDRRKRWLCIVCERSFSETRIKNLYFRFRKPLVAQTAIKLSDENWSIREIAKSLKVSKSSVLNWLKKRKLFLKA